MNKLKKKIVFLIPTLFLAIAMLFFLIIPFIFEIITISTDINDKKILLRNKPSLSKDIKAYLNKLDEIEKSAVFTSSFIFPGKELEFIEALEKIAESCEVKQNIDISHSPQEDKGGEIVLSIDLEGSYINLIKYLTRIEKEKYYINIYSLSIDSSKIVKGITLNNKLKMSINGHAFLK